MFELSTILLGLLMFLVAYWFLNIPRNIPPYPKPRLPILGNLLHFQGARSSGNLAKFLRDLSKELGNVFSLWFGSRLVVFLNDYTSIKEAMVTKGDHFIERPDGLLVIDFLLKKTGLVWANGKTWKELRRYALMTMRDMGLGKKSLELRIQEEADFLTQEFLKYEGKPFSASRGTQKAVSNIICGICFGKRYNYEDKEFIKMMEMIRLIATNLSFALPQNFIPLLKFLPYPKSVQLVVNNSEAVMNLVEAHIEEHQKTFDPDNIRDFVDIYIQKEQEGHSDDDIFSRLNMKRTVMDLFLAGTETTATTLNWCLLYLIANPHIQEKCYGHLQQVVGCSRPPSLSDRAKLPYIIAVIQEAQRIRSVVPIGIPRTATTDTSIGGYHIPNHTIVFVNQYAMHMSSTYWAEPEVFKPERWIRDGEIIKHDEFAPFSMGSRACLGEQLARTELFIFLSTIIQKFKLKMEDGVTIDLQGKMGVSLSPKSYNIILETR